MFNLDLGNCSRQYNTSSFKQFFTHQVLLCKSKNVKYKPPKKLLELILLYVELQSQPAHLFRLYQWLFRVQRFEGNFLIIWGHHTLLVPCEWDQRQWKTEKQRWQHPLCTLIICTEALVEAKQQHYGSNDDQFEDPWGPQLCPGPDILAHDGLNQGYLPMLFLPGL